MLRGGVSVHEVLQFPTPTNMQYRNFEGMVVWRCMWDAAAFALHSVGIDDRVVVGVLRVRERLDLHTNIRSSYR